MAVGGAAAVAWPLIDQLNPSADTVAEGSPLIVDLSKIDPGQQIILIWRKNPMFIVHRTPANLTTLGNPGDLALLRDPDSDSRQQPAYAKNWSRSIKPEYLVLIGVCTHLGRSPTYKPNA